MTYAFRRSFILPLGLALLCASALTAGQAEAAQRAVWAADDAAPGNPYLQRRQKIRETRLMNVPVAPRNQPAAAPIPAPAAMAAGEPLKVTIPDLDAMRHTRHVSTQTVLMPYSRPEPVRKNQRGGENAARARTGESSNSLLAIISSWLPRDMAAGKPGSKPQTQEAGPAPAAVTPEAPIRSVASVAPVTSLVPLVEPAVTVAQEETPPAFPKAVIADAALDAPLVTPDFTAPQAVAPQAIARIDPAEAELVEPNFEPEAPEPGRQVAQAPPVEAPKVLMESPGAIFERASYSMAQARQVMIQQAPGPEPGPQAFAQLAPAAGGEDSAQQPLIELPPAEPPPPAPVPPAPPNAAPVPPSPAVQPPTPMPSEPTPPPMPAAPMPAVPAGDPAAVPATSVSPPTSPALPALPPPPALPTPNPIIPSAPAGIPEGVTAPAPPNPILKALPDPAPSLPTPTLPAIPVPLPAAPIPAVQPPVAEKPVIPAAPAPAATPEKPTKPVAPPVKKTDAGKRSDQEILRHIPSGMEGGRQAGEPFEVTHTRESPPALKRLEDDTSSKHEAMGIKIEVKKPRLDVNYELEKAYSASVAGNRDAAIAGYKSVLEVDPENTNALFGLATLYQRVGLNEQARPLFARLLAIDPANRDGLNNYLAMLADAEPQEALAQLDKLGSRNPSFSPIPAQMALIHQRMGNPEKAAELMRRAVELAPENLTYRYNLAILYDKQKRYDEAAALYAQIVKAYRNGESIPGDATKIQQRLTFIRSNRS